MHRKILIFLLTMILVLTAVPQGMQMTAIAEASANAVTTENFKKYCNDNFKYYISDSIELA